ncbi:MAG: DUF4132 domain-containing protein [Verrucomicrobiae bacterium]|nr:DUF4132 domain-containing protein [Verrucomicrobiae bacterium]
MAATLFKRSFPWDEAGFTALCEGVEGIRFWGYPEPRPLFPAVAARHKKSVGVFSSGQLEVLGRICKAWDAEGGNAAKWARKLHLLMENEAGAPPPRVFRNGEIFAGRLLDDWEGMDESARSPWARLLAHVVDSSASKPSTKWIARARELLSPVGEVAFAESMLSWLPLIDKPAADGRQQEYPGSTYVRRIDPMEICDPHLDILKGLVWMAGLLDIDELTRLIGRVGVSAYRKIPGTGPRATRVGNACVWALGNIGSDCALSQLAMMKVRVKFGSAQIAIGKALQTLADARGVTSDELEEMSVPSYGMTRVGRLEEKLGEHTAVIDVIGGKPVLSFLKPDGSPQKSVPAAVKENFASDLKELKGSAKDIEKMLSAQRERLDNLYLQRKSWPFRVWRERYLDHPLVGIMVRSLIWSFQAGPDAPVVNAIWHDGGLRDVDANLIEPTEEALVHLWHPIDAGVSEIVRWRNWLFEHLVRQPFKQAHREVYILTDAERNTGTYSNRFASHILKQHQFNSLCAVRGWKNKLRLMVDDEYPPATRLLPTWGLRAEYWIEGVGDDYNDEYVTDSGAYRYIVTDQVRFYRIDAAQATAHAGGGGYGPRWGGSLEEAMPVESVPPLVLSEVLRDVDLFVGVTSVGNDPAWSDGGPQGRHEDYWSKFSFGELGETAEIRKELIGSLLPRLKIAKQCRLSGRFLIVKGSLRTYKIHLGSGNILMEPDDRYLCIVKAATSTGGQQVFLPFEGDSKLSVILSKAFLLAADTKIKDPTILSQINANR